MLNPRKWLLPLLVVVALFGLLVKVKHRQELRRAALLAPKKLSPLKVVFEPDFGVTGTVLHGNISVFHAGDTFGTFDATLQTLTIGYNRGERPYPQYEIFDIQGSGGNSDSPAMDSNSLPMTQSGMGWANDDLRRYKGAMDGVEYVRMKVVAMQGRKDPKLWTHPDCAVFFSPWMPYRPAGAKKTPEPNSKHA